MLAVAGALMLAAAAHAGAPGPDLRPTPGQAPQAPTALIELDGTLSENPDGGNLQYEWRQVEGPRVTLSDPAAAKPNFRTAEPGVYRFELVVTANGLRSAPTPVEIEIERANLAPVAKTPAEIRGQVGRRIEIDGRESFDPEGRDLTYRWRALTAGLEIPAAALNMPVLAFGPETDGVYEVELVVSDGETASPPAVTRLAIAPLPRPPVARAKIVPIEIPTLEQPDGAGAGPSGPRPTARITGPATADPGTKVVLDGAGSTGRPGARLEYLWRQKSGPFVADLAATNGGAEGSFTPPRAGEYEFELVVSDGPNASAAAVHRITVRKGAEPPVAVVVAPALAETGTLVRMDATQSYDPAGGKLNYRWRQTGGPQVRNYALDAKLGDAAPAFTPTAEGTYVFEVIATNGKNQSRPVEISIDVAPAQRGRQLAITGPDVGNVGESLILTAESTGFAGRNPQFRWRQAEGAAGAMTRADGARVTVSPPAPGRYTFDLSALEDGQVVATARRSIEVFAAEPVETAGGLRPAGTAGSSATGSAGGAGMSPSAALSPSAGFSASHAEAGPSGPSAVGARNLIPELQPLPSIAPPPTARAPGSAPPAPALTPLPLASPMPMAAPAMPAARTHPPMPVPVRERSGAAGRAAAQIHPATLSGGSGAPPMADLP